jgi:hypothetical protein
MTTPGQYLTSWLEEQVVIDPLLKEPLELSGSIARRRTLIVALLRQLQLEHRYESGTMHGSTLEVTHAMLERLADLRNEGRAHLPSAAESIVRGRRQLERPLDPSVAGTALMDFGWGHLDGIGGTIRDQLHFMADELEMMLGRKVLGMLRRWERRGLIIDSDQHLNHK